MGLKAEAVGVDANGSVAAAQRRVSAAITLADYLSLTKPRAMLLVVVTALAGMAVAARDLPPLVLVLATLCGGCLTSAGANALNCYVDRDIDALMGRTQKRPLPAGRLRPNEALLFGLTLTTLGTLVLFRHVNWLAASLALGANLFYVLGYTAYLKRKTAQNIVIGGAAGAAAPLIGWAAVSGGVDLTALSLAAVVLFWTPPHFWSLALLTATDYRRAGVPMLPVARGEHATRRQILLYAFAAAVAGLLPAAVGSLGRFYLVAEVVLSLGLIALAAALVRVPSRRLTRALFRYSVVYLGLLCLAMVVDVLGSR